MIKEWKGEEKILTKAHEMDGRKNYFAQVKDESYKVSELTSHIWSLEELVTYRAPLPRKAT